MPKGSLSKSSTTSESVTLRLGADVLGELREEAKMKRIRLNTLATQIFRTHIEYGSMASRAGMISIHKSLPMLIMEEMSEGEILKLSEYIAKE